MFEKIMELLANTENQSLRKLTHIVITDPDGDVSELDSEMWVFVGINDFQKTLQRRIYAVSDDSIPATSRRIQLLAQLSAVCEEISKGIVEHSPGMTNERLYELVRMVMEQEQKNERNVSK